MARTAWESVVGWSPGPVKELAPVPGRALYSSEGLSEMVVPEALGLDSLSGAVLHKTSGRDELSSESKRSLMMSLVEAGEAEEPGVLSGPSGSPRLAIRRSAQMLKSELLVFPVGG